MSNYSFWLRLRNALHSEMNNTLGSMHLFDFCSMLHSNDVMRCEFFFSFHSCWTAFRAHSYCALCWPVYCLTVALKDQQWNEFTNPSAVSCSSVSLIFNSNGTGSRVETARKKRNSTYSGNGVSIRFVRFMISCKINTLDYNQHMRRHGKRFRSFCPFRHCSHGVYALD